MNSIFFVSLVEIKTTKKKTLQILSRLPSCKKNKNKKKTDNKTLYLFSLYILRMCASRPQFPVSLSTRSPHIVLMCFYGEGYNRVDGFIVECRVVYMRGPRIYGLTFSPGLVPSFLPSYPLDLLPIFSFLNDNCASSHPDYVVSSTDR